MPIKSRRYHKKNKSHRSRKNKITRRYKKQKGRGSSLANLAIENENDLAKQWINPMIGIWEADDGMGTRERFFREGTTYDKLKKYLNYYLKKIENGTEGAWIRGFVI